MNECRNTAEPSHRSRAGATALLRISCLRHGCLLLLLLLVLLLLLLLLMPLLLLSGWRR